MDSEPCKYDVAKYRFKMQNIDEYMKQTRQDRRAHLDLSVPCDERGGDSREFRGLLAHSLDTSIPKGYTTHLCHACNNSECSNPKHLYWGTPSDNNLDRAIDLRAKGIYKPRRQFRPSKRYTPQKIARYHAVISKYKKTWGWLGECATEIGIGISHTQLRRFLNKYPYDVSLV